MKLDWSIHKRFGVNAGLSFLDAVSLMNLWINAGTKSELWMSLHRWDLKDAVVFRNLIIIWWGTCGKSALSEIHGELRGDVSFKLMTHICRCFFLPASLHWHIKSNECQKIWSWNKLPKASSLVFTLNFLGHFPKTASFLGLFPNQIQYQKNSKTSVDLRQCWFPACVLSHDSSDQVPEGYCKKPLRSHLWRLIKSSRT